MGELLFKLVSPLLDPLAERLQARIRDLSLLAKITIAAIALFCAVLIYYRDEVPTFTADAGRAVRILLARSYIPLDSKVKSESRDIVTHLFDGIEAELTKPHNLEPPSAWTLAQLVASRTKNSKFDRRAVIAYFHEVGSSLCHCWEEVPDDGAPMVAVAGWVLFALSTINEPVSVEQLEYMLNEQNADGSWSIFRNPVNEDNKASHSTFATAWAILGLKSQLDMKLPSSSVQDHIATSLKEAAAWLISQRLPGSRWKPYPLVPNGGSSDSLSGLALHALHVADPDNSLLEQHWLDDLPPTVPKPDESDYRLQWFKTRDGTRHDHFHHLRLPWLLMATADAYSSGSFVQRMHALRWLEQALVQQNIEGSLTSDKDDWWRAEVLLAVQYVLSKSESR